MVNYTHRVVKLSKRKEANGLKDVITSVTIHYVATKGDKEAIARCTLDFDIPENSNGFIPYADVTHNTLIEWSKTRIKYENFNQDLERQLDEIEDEIIVL